MNNKVKNITKDFKEGLSLSKLLAPLALVIVYAFFAIFGRNFFSYTTLVNILDSSYYIGFLAIGVTFVIITGGIDLSCGTVMMAATIIGGTAYKTWGWPMWLSLVLILVVSTSFGLFVFLFCKNTKKSTKKAFLFFIVFRNRCIFYFSSIFI